MDDPENENWEEEANRQADELLDEVLTREGY